MPNRIQLKRTKGWRKPDGAVVVTRATRFGNPFKIGGDDVPDADTAVRLFRELAEREMREMGPGKVREVLGPLRGKDLACWCKLDAPCHADVLLEIVNNPDNF